MPGEEQTACAGCGNTLSRARPALVAMGAMDLPIALFALPQERAALEAALPHAGGQEAVDARVRLAWFLRQADTPRALQLADEAEALCSGAAAPAARRAAWRARLELVRGEARRLRGDAAGALGHLERARRVYEAMADLAGQADAALLMAARTAMLEDPASYESALADAARAAERLGDPVRIGVVALQRAIRENVQQVPAVRERWREAMAQARALDHPVLSANLEQLEGSLASDSPLLTLPHYERGHALARETGQFRLAYSCALSLADLNERLGELEAALRWTEHAGLAAHDWPWNQGDACSMAARVLRRLGRLEAALACIDQAMALIRPLETGMRTLLFSERAEILLDLADPRGAIEVLDEGEPMTRRSGSALFLLRHQLAKARACTDLGRVADALASLDAADACCQGPVHRVAIVRARARLALRHGLPAPAGSPHASAAIHHLEAALALAREIDGLRMPPELHAELSGAYERAGDLAQALRHAREGALCRDRLDAQKARDLAVALHARFETERARSDAAHQRELAEAQGARADAEAEAHRAKSAFLAHMSHELRSPLNAMLGLSRLVARDDGLPVHLRHDMGIVVRSGEHLHHLVDQLLTLSRIEAGREPVDHLPFDLPALLEDLAALHAAAAAERGLALAHAPDASLPRHVRGDAARLRQVLVNLLGNALKFTPRGGTVTLAAQAQPEGDGWRVDLGVQDTGVGIEGAELARLGEAFVQASAGREQGQGTGLGLAISRGLAERMGGRLHIDSQPGAGTTVIVSLPLGHAAASDDAGPAPAPGRERRLAPGQAAWRVLAVDDLAEGRRLLCRLLEPAGFELREAASGEEALAAWRAWRPHLVCMDLRMPGMDGAEATRRIRAEPGGRETIVIALTASGEEEAAAAGADWDGIVRKPIDEAALFELMAERLGARFAAPAAGATTPAPELGAARLRELPQALRSELRAALAGLDVARVGRAVDAVRCHDGALAQALDAAVQRFDYAAVERLLDDAA